MLSALPGRARRSARGGMRLTAAALTALMAVSLCLSPARASASTVRQAEAWVLTALNVPSAWSISRGAGVTVAVIDSGVDPAVSDLTGSVITGPDMTGVSTPVSNPDWGVHGTWMGSLIAGHGDGPADANGIIGVAPLARLLSIRVITDRTDPNYALYEHEPQVRGQRELAAAITYAVAHGASVISMSLGYMSPSSAVRSSLQDAFDHNVVVVASAGNSGDTAGAVGTGHAPYSFPADYPGVLGVAAVDATGSPAGFSSENLSVQVAAPGVNVPAEGRGDQYWLVSGTSPACALVAGVAALIKARYRGLSAAEVDSAITTTTTNRPPGGYDQQVGFGTVDAAAALAAAGRLAAQSSPGQVVSAASHFGGGPAAVPASPVRSRGPLGLVLFCLLGAGCLAILAVATRLLRALRSGPELSGAGPVPGQPYQSAAPVTAGPGWSVLRGDRGTTAGDVLPPDPAPGRPVPGRPVPGRPVPAGSLNDDPLAVDVASGDRASGDRAPGDPAPAFGDVVPGDVVPGDVVPGDVVPGDAEPGGTPGWRPPGGKPQNGRVHADQPGDAQVPDPAMRGRDLPGGDLPDDRSPDQQSLASRFPWQPAPGGRHAAERRGTGRRG
ncbi:MAG: S8 family serine peptidase [Streptosporangiaceae bacterium]